MKLLTNNLFLPGFADGSAEAIRDYRGEEKITRIKIKIIPAVSGQGKYSYSDARLKFLQFKFAIILLL